MFSAVIHYSLFGMSGISDGVTIKSLMGYFELYNIYIRLLSSTITEIYKVYMTLVAWLMHE